MLKLLTVCAAALSMCASALGQVEAAQAALDAARAENGVPGMSAAVWVDDALAWTGQSGLADLELDVPVSEATRFRLGSVAKVFTASLAAKLAAEGRVDLDRPLREWMTDLPEHYDGVTLRMLLGHLGGVRHYQMLDHAPLVPGGSIDVRWYPTTESALAIFIEDPLVGAPGEKYSYSTFAYTLVSAALERATNKSFEDLLQEEVIEPLGLESLAIDAYRDIIPNRATPYDQSSPRMGEPEGEVRNSTPLNSAYKVAAGGLVATPSDIAKFGAAHFDASFLGDAMFTQAFTSQVDGAGEETGCGLGWRIAIDHAGRTFYGHGGSQQGCRAAVIVYPEQRVAVALMGNLGGVPRNIEAIAMDIAAGWLPAGAPAPVGGD